MKKKHIIALLMFIAALTFFACKYYYIFYKNITDKPKNYNYYEKSAFIPPKKIIQKSAKLSVEKIKVPILLYHYVEIVTDARDTIRKSLNINPNVFEKQIQTLLENSYTPIFIDELADYLDGKMELPKKPVILTFDDGYGDFYTDVFPILTKYKVKATIYVVPGFLDKINYMTTKQIQEVASSSGIVEIASHTMHHINLKYVKTEIVRKEIFESKDKLEKLIGRSVTNFAYPYGGFNEETEKLVEQAGYKTAASVVAGSYQSAGNRFYLFRLRPGARTGKFLTDWLDSLRE